MDAQARTGQEEMLRQAFVAVLDELEASGLPPTFVQITVPTETEATYRLGLAGQEDYEGGFISR